MTFPFLSNNFYENKSCGLFKIHYDPPEYSAWVQGILQPTRWETLGYGILNFKLKHFNIPFW